MRFLFISAFLAALFGSTSAPAATLTGEIRDEATGQLVAARLYIQSADGKWFFARSTGAGGKAVEYRKERGPKSNEMHTSLSAHPFTVELPAGKYTLTAERGKEYLPVIAQVDVGNQPVRTELRLARWINMAQQGWYSGDTHVHRTLEELPTAMLADDLNVAFPLTYWVTRSDTSPQQGDKNQPPVEPKLIEVTPQHVIWPLNTEYEIFTVGEKRHTLGAVFGLGHRNVLNRGVPPVKPIADQVHGEGGLLDLDKHNWPWSMMLIPVMNVDLYELSNNHIWRTEFAFRTWGEQIPAYMNLPQGPAGMDEKSWTEFGFQNYYALLNCGFRLMPTAGTASGVHPVPLGWGRVYVNCQGGFSYEAWLKGLAAGRSFVTTGPMMRFEVVYLQGDEADARPCHILAQTAGHGKQRRVELIENGKVISFTSGDPRGGGGWESHINQARVVKSSAWFALRCFYEGPDGRERFAHSAPVFIDIPGKPIRPRKAEVEYLISRMKAEIERNTGVLTEESLAEYRTALAKYEEIANTAE